MGWMLSGQGQLRAALRAEGDKALHALGGALYREGSEIIGVSQDQYAPVDVGVLRSSGFVDLPEYSGTHVSVQIGYGGAAEDYALVQHERLDFHHTVGQAKYLERPMLEAENGLEARLAADIRSHG